MARNGSGTYDLPGADFTNGTLADADEVMTKLDDIATALTASIAKDGQTTPTAALPMGGFNHTNVGVATARTHYARASQIADGALTYGGVATGTADALAIAPSPAITAYAIGQQFQFKVGASANTTAATLNVNTVGAGSITWPDGTALVAGDLPANSMVVVVVQATTPVFHLVSQTRSSALNISGLTEETSPSSSDVVPVYDVSATANRKMSFTTVFKAINGLNTETTVDTANDFIPMYDASGGTTDKITPVTLFAAVNGLAADATPDPAADYVMTYDASATTAKKVLLQYMGRPVSSQTASSSAQLDFTIDSNFDYEFYLDRVLPATDGASLYVRFSVDGGSTFLATNTYSNNYTGLTTALNGSTSGTATEITVASTIDGGNPGASGRLSLVVGGAAAYGTNLVSSLRYIENSGGAHVLSVCGGSNSTSSQVNAIRFLMSSGNIASGTIRMRAIPK